MNNKFSSTAKTCLAGLLILLLLFNSGCYQSLVFLDAETVPKHNNLKILELVTKSGKHIKFDENGGKYFEYDSGKIKYCAVTGTTNEGIFVQISYDDIVTVVIRDRSFTSSWLQTTALLSLAIAAGYLGLIFLLWDSSCPYIYVKNGNDYKFSGISFPGAITSVMERTDYTLLESVPDSNIIEIMLRNDPPNEQQKIDFVQLLKFEHDEKSIVVPDEKYNFYSIENITPPSSASSADGIDINPLLRKKDSILWLSDKTFDDSAIRDTIYINFLYPNHPDSIKLFFRGNNTFWGANMIYKYLDLKGKSIEDWYDYPLIFEKEIRSLFHLFDKAELFKLSVKVFDGKEYIHKGYIRGSGSFFRRNSLLSIDLKNLKSDTIKIMLTPPSNFWCIDEIGICKNIKSLSPSYPELSSVVDHYNYFRQTLILKEDGKYFDMDRAGDLLLLTYNNKMESGKKSSYYLKVKGYFHTGVNHEFENPALLESFYKNPDKLIEYSNEMIKKEKKKYGCNKP